MRTHELPHDGLETPRTVPGRSRLRAALYHNISESSSPFFDDIKVSIKPAEFERHIGYFQRNYDIVSLNEVLSGNLPKRPFLLTFDDAYRSVFDFAVPLLSRLGLPALFFISSGQVDGKILMNDNVLCYLARSIGLARLEMGITGRPSVCSSVSELIGTVVSTLDYASQARLAIELAERYSIAADVLEDLRKLYITHAQVGQLPAQGIEVANHTYSHVFCRHLDFASEDLEILQAQSFPTTMDRPKSSRVQHSLRTPGRFDRAFEPTTLSFWPRSHLHGDIPAKSARPSRSSLGSSRHATKHRLGNLCPDRALSLAALATNQKLIDGPLWTAPPSSLSADMSRSASPALSKGEKFPRPG